MKKTVLLIMLLQQMAFAQTKNSSWHTCLHKDLFGRQLFLNRCQAVDIGTQLLAFFKNFDNAARSLILQENNPHKVLAFVGGTGNPPTKATDTSKIAAQPPYESIIKGALILTVIILFVILLLPARMREQFWGARPQKKAAGDDPKTPPTPSDDEKPDNAIALMEKIDKLEERITAIEGRLNAIENPVRIATWDIAKENNRQKENAGPEEDHDLLPAEQNTILDTEPEPETESIAVSRDNLVFAQLPDIENGFSPAIINSQQNGERAYEIDINGESASFGISNDVKVQKYVLSEYNYFLDAACEMRNQPFKNCRIHTQKRGTLLKVNDNWIIQTKAIIEFE